MAAKRGRPRQARGSRFVIKVCAVLGSGVMGNGIAHSLAAGGFDVVMIDTSAEAVAAGLSRIDQNLAIGVERGKVSAAESAAIRARITTSTSLAAASAAGLIVEAVPEVMQIKHAVLRELDAVCSADAIFATNTSALSITEIAAAVERPSRVIGMHYFNPAHIMKLIEIVRGLEIGRGVRHGGRSCEGLQKGDGARQRGSGVCHQPHQCDDRQ
jgi:3-hydroxybutyryl-CoA dehydrogenase